MTPHKTLLDSIACDLTGSFHLFCKQNTYSPVCMCPLTNYPTAIPIPEKTAETLTFIPVSGKELKNGLFQEVVNKVGKKHQFLSSYQP